MSDTLTPITRQETFLARAGGQDVTTPTPVTREEIFLQAIIDNEGGGGATSWIGVTTTALTDGATTNPITINGESVTAVAGNITSYGADEFIYNGSAWQLFGAANAAPLVCTFSKSGNNIVCDKTQTEIVAAYEAKKEVLAYVPKTVVGSNWPTIEDRVLRLAGVVYSNSVAILIQFESEYRKAADSGVSASCGVLSLSSTFVIAAWSPWSASYRAALPTAIESDNGKFLGVSSGDWAALTLPTELPSVTSSDNGKDLSVVDGAWAAVMKDPLVVTYTITGAAVNGAYPLSANYTFEEILAAYYAGRDVIGRCNIPIGINFMTLSANLNELLVDGNSSSPTYGDPIMVMYALSGIEQSAMTGMAGSVRHMIDDTASLALDYFPLTSQFSYDSTTHTLTLNL